MVSIERSIEQGCRFERGQARATSGPARRESRRQPRWKGLTDECVLTLTHAMHSVPSGLGKPDIPIGTEHACASAVRMRGASGRASGQEADAWFDQTPTLTTDIHSASSRFRHRISTSRHPPEPYRESARVVRMRGTPNARGRRGNPRRTSPAAHRTPALTLRKHSIFRRCAARLSTPLASYSAAFGYPHLSNAQRVEWFRCRVIHTGNCGEICCRRIRRVDSRVCSYCSPHAGKPRRFGLRRALTIRMHSISSARKGRLSTSAPQRRIRRGGRRNAVIRQSTG